MTRYHSFFGLKNSGVFSIQLHLKDRAVLECIQAYFGGIGTIYNIGNNKVQYKVLAIKELAVIIAHFDQYPLRTQKSADFLLFKRGVAILQSNRHLTKEGLLELISIRGSLNWGLTDVLKNSFPDVIIAERPKVEVTDQADPNWVAGFVSGEGSFFIVIRRSESSKTGFYIYLTFKITQDGRDVQVLKGFEQYFNCGNVNAKDSKKAAFDYVCGSFKDNLDIIIPFFTKYPIYGTKALDFEDWCRVAELIKTNSHLKPEGLVQIESIKSGMNRSRKLHS